MARKIVYQFKVVLDGIHPLIWRRIQVPETYNFWDLHVAIQDAFGWFDYHLHVFRMRRKNSRQPVEIGIPDDSGVDKIKPGFKVALADYFNDLGTVAEYEYDFGDRWRHEVILEGYLLKEKGIKYPRCTEGNRACPPEDCGGVDGYYNLLQIIGEPDNEEYEETMAWLGGKFDPEHFVPGKVKFDNPKKRFQKAFCEG